MSWKSISVLVASLLATSPLVSAAPVVPPVNGLTISQARDALNKAGWKPIHTELKMADGTLENQWGDARLLYEGGFREVESCSGTGANYCFFNYSRSGQCVRLTTAGEFKQGEYEPLVLSLSRECPPKETIPKAKNAT